MRGVVLEWRGPILPAERAGQRRRKGLAHRLGGLAVALLLRVENAEKENPRKLRHVLQGARAIRAAQDVADGFDESGQRTRSRDGLRGLLLRLFLGGHGL